MQTKNKEISFFQRKDNYQPNSLTLAKQEWGVNERRVLAYVINQIDHTSDYSNVVAVNFQIPIRVLSEHIDYKLIKKTINNLQSKKIFYEDETEGSEEFESLILFPLVNYNKGKNGLVELTVLGESMPFLTQLGKAYTRYNLSVFLSLGSMYSQRIFEILMMEYRQGKGRKEFRYKLDTLQDVLGSKYNDFYDFKRFCLLPAQKEIYEKAEIIFEYEISKKNGKKVTEITFKIQSMVDIAFQNVKDELECFEAAEPAQVYNVARHLLETQYTFKDKQVSLILSNPDTLKLFVELNSKIENGLITIKVSRTKYMAVALGLN